MTEPHDEEPGFRVTVRDVYKIQTEMQTTLTTIAERLPAHVTKTDSALADHESRLRAIETRMWIAFGIVSVFLLGRDIIIPLIT